jgi:hypothetical protein
VCVLQALARHRLNRVTNFQLPKIIESNIGCKK